MFGFKYAKFDPNTYVIVHKNGRVSKEGVGLSFFYFAPSTSIVAIPKSSNDLPFIFEEMTNDYQAIRVQGQITYTIEDPHKLAAILDYSVDARGVYKKSDHEKLGQRIINEAQTTTTSFVHTLSLKESLRSAAEIGKIIEQGLGESQSLAMMGIKVLGVNILGIKGTPEMTRALETETRELLQKEADRAIYERRNFAVEQERVIKESELSTQIAVEEKKKQIAEKKMELKVLNAENDKKLREMKVEEDISVEEMRSGLLAKKEENDRKEADIEGYVIQQKLEPYKNLDWKLLMALNGNSDSSTHIAMAFRELAENAENIQNLNITPDLLNTVMQQQSNR